MRCPLLLTLSLVMPASAAADARAGTALSAVAFSPDGKWLAAGGAVGVVTLWDGRGRKQLQTLRCGAEVRGLAFAPRGDRLAAACEDRQVRIWMRSGDEFRPEHTLRCRGSVKAVAFAPDGRLVACGTSGAGNIYLYDPVKGVLRRTLWEASNGIEALAFTPDGKTLVSAGNGLKLWDLPAAGIKPDAAEGLDVPLEELRRREARLVRKRLAGYWVVGVAVSPDGSLLASAGHLDAGGEPRAPKSVGLWDAKTGKLLRTLARGPAQITSVAFSPDGSRVAAFSRDGAVRLWEASTGKLVRTWQVQAGERGSVAFAPDGSLLAAADAGGAVYVWDVKTGELREKPTPGPTSS
jgi:WD40 repeat protein